VSRVFSVVLCAAMALGCVWAQQGLTALGDMTTGFLSDAEAKKITKEPFVVYLSGVDTRGELTEKARSDVNIIAAVNPETKQVVLINTPRDYYVDLAGTNSKDKLTPAGPYGGPPRLRKVDSLNRKSLSETVPPPNRSHLPTTQTLAVCGRSNRPFAYSFAPPER